MNNIEQIMPKSATIELAELLAQIKAANAVYFSVNHPSVSHLCARLSEKLLNDVRAKLYPELSALGFWLRPASIEQMLQEYFIAPRSSLRVPAGIVLQFPPSNVDALFAYSAIIALLCGNICVLRLSSQIRPAQTCLLDLLTECLAESEPQLRQRLIILRYQHDEIITTALSAVCNLRLVWGGDETVKAIRKIPYPALAREVSFADRFSASVINSTAYLAADSPIRSALAHQFYNDLYWYDQLACASPRLLTWIGTAKQAQTAAADFYNLLGNEAQKYQLAAGGNLAKLNSTYLALHDLSVEDYQTISPALTVIKLSSTENLSAFKSINFGFGLLLTQALEDLQQLAKQAEPRDQTLTVWGFAPERLQNFTAQCQGKGFDRIIPIGTALSFDPVWDGCNLFAEMTRLIRINHA